MKRTLSNKNHRLTSKSIVALLAVIFFLFSNGSSLKAQHNDYQFGVRGGMGMATLSGFQNNGLRLGVVGGVFGKYFLNDHTSIIADFNYSMGGQQSEKWITEQRGEHLKVYSKYNLHYLNIPILYQYYFTDILGLEAGADFRFCVNANLKTKIGNEQWQKQTLKYNTFDFGFIFGVYTDNLIPDDNFYVSLRAYFGFLDVVKEVGSNKNISVQISVGYTIK